MTDKQRALEPCPFCGSPAWEDCVAFGQFNNVCCTKVGCPLESVGISMVDWNRRVSKPATPEGWKTTVWQAWRLLNEIRARDGTAYQDTKYQMYRQEYRTHDDFNQLVEDMRAILGEDAQPWPPSAAAPVQEEI